jgi:hypothetical protein
MAAAADAAEGVGEMLGDVFAIGRLQACPAFARATQLAQQVQADRTQAPQVDNHFTESDGGVRR